MANPSDPRQLARTAGRKNYLVKRHAENVATGNGGLQAIFIASCNIFLLRRAVASGNNASSRHRGTPSRRRYFGRDGCRLPKRRIYVASSWRNSLQPDVVAALREEGHEVYDFRNPAEGNNGFGWRQVDEGASNWTPRRFAELVTSHPIAAQGFAFDKAALDWCDTCVLVLPSGRSAHLEAGYACGQGKHVFVMLHEDKFEPELMYLLAKGIGCSIGDMLVHFRHADDRCKAALGWDNAKPLPQSEAA